MPHTLSATPNPSPASTPELATFGAVHLEVTDGDRALAFWRDLLGLHLRDREAGALILGTERDPLLVLHPGAGAPVRRGCSGLYHLAIHLPGAPEFGRVLARLIALQVPIAPTDHVASKSIYLDDPDGIGLELTLETPERMGEARLSADGRPEIIDSAGRRRSGRDPLDLEAALRPLGDGRVADPLAPGTKIGHVHLAVGDLHAAERFYADALGFLPGVHLASVGMCDLHAAGAFRHRIALNIWQGVGAPQPPAGTAGLRHFTVRYDTGARLGAALERLPGAAPCPGGHLVHDPSGNAIVLAG